ncbi:MAG TPA: DNA internalization-related competence protein ComEC/Rec2 [Candidatus Acidoferrales bacterium]|nr:DNA internalization-related competence protein ComEC/Rec2 [Candidatus Acidoferrales bacterium]
MKLPALALALAFACGIAVEPFLPIHLHIWLIAAALSILTGLIFHFCSRWTFTPVLFALAAWFALGGFALRLARLDVSPNDVAHLIASHKIDASEPLRWQGTLREDPEKLPWGLRYTIDLSNVAIAGQAISIQGGLRLTYYSGENDSEPPPMLRAGDALEVLCRARIPRNYQDPGVFDERAFLARQGIELLATLRSPELIQKIASPRISISQRFARVHGDLLTRLDDLYAGDGSRIAVLRAMLLGDRNFVNSDIADNFQRTAAFHVLVLAGLHVGVLAAFIFWLCKLLRLPLPAATLLTILLLAGYVGVVQDRPPILRAALMAAIFLCARLQFRRVALVNTVALAALILLIARPDELFDASFQLSFVAAGVIAGLGLPWVDRTSSHYRRALEHLGDVTRDRLHSPRATQFRLDLRAIVNHAFSKLPRLLALHSESLFTIPVRFGLRIWDLFVLSFSIQLGMMALLAFYFHRVSISGPVSNILAVLLTAVIVPLGFFGLGASYIWYGLGAVIAKVEGVLVGWLLASIGWFSRLPHASWRIPGPPLWVLAAFMAVLASLACLAWTAAQGNRFARETTAANRMRRIAEQLIFALLIGLGFVVAIYPFRPSLAPGRLEATVLDVGQGDSIFVAFPDGQTMLIDGGGAAGTERIGGYQSGIDVGEQVVSPYLWSRGVKKLDVVLLSHAHHDHIDGLFSVLKNFRVGQLWVGRDENAAAYDNLLSQATAEGIPIVHKRQGSSFDWQGIMGQFFWPEDLAEAPAAANNDSVVLRLGDGSIHFLLSGDIEKEAENTLVDEREPLSADFLKVPHHGSKTSSTEEFLDAVAPRVAAISVGKENPYGLPYPATVQRYEEKKINLFRTDRDGALTVSTDGRNLYTSDFARMQKR